MPYSYHSHSGQFCKHGYGLLEDVVKEAIRKGFHGYGLSEHMPRYDDSELYPEEIEVKKKLFLLLLLMLTNVLLRLVVHQRL